MLQAISKDELDYGKFETNIQTLSQISWPQPVIRPVLSRKTDNNNQLPTPLQSTDNSNISSYFTNPQTQTSIITGGVKS